MEVERRRVEDGQSGMEVVRDREGGKIHTGDGILIYLPWEDSLRIIHHCVII